MSIFFQAIGTIHSPFSHKEDMPIQPAGAKGVKGQIKLKEKYAAGLKDLEHFSHIILIYHFHKVKDYNLEVTPFLDDQPHGIFATRAPKRPNPIGFSVVKLIAIDKNTLYIEDIDVIDGTPLLDIKPYVPEFDFVEVEKTGWLSNKTHLLPKTKSDDRF